MKTKRRVSKTLSKALTDFDGKSIKEIIQMNTAITNEQVKRLEHGRTISISDLPDCVHKTALIGAVQNPKDAKIVVVAFINADQTWQVYAGYPDVRDLKPLFKDYADIVWFCENINDINQTIMMGTKLEKNVAAILFPDWDISKYKEIKNGQRK